jgi:hypothetical protein
MLASANPEALPPAMAIIPQADLKPIYDFLEDCRANQAELAAAKETLFDERAKQAALATERDAALRAARKGSTWSRITHNAKWFLLGAATAAITISAKQSP